MSICLNGFDGPTHVMMTRETLQRQMPPRDLLRNRGVEYGGRNN